jgi:hypothetical protein
MIDSQVINRGLEAALMMQREFERFAERVIATNAADWCGRRRILAA